jgi:hypothetical protein
MRRAPARTARVDRSIRRFAATTRIPRRYENRMDTHERRGGLAAVRDPMDVPEWPRTCFFRGWRVGGEEGEADELERATGMRADADRFFAALGRPAQAS